MAPPQLDLDLLAWVRRIPPPILHDLTAACAVPFEIREVSVERRAMAMEVSFTVCVPLESDAHVMFLGTGKPPQDIADLVDKMQDVVTDALDKPSDGSRHYKHLDEVCADRLKPQPIGNHPMTSEPGSMAVWQSSVTETLCLIRPRCPGRDSNPHAPKGRRV